MEKHRNPTNTAPKPKNPPTEADPQKGAAEDPHNESPLRDSYAGDGGSENGRGEKPLSYLLSNPQLQAALLLA